MIRMMMNQVVPGSLEEAKREREREKERERERERQREREREDAAMPSSKLRPLYWLQPGCGAASRAVLHNRALATISPATDIQPTDTARS